METLTDHIEVFKLEDKQHFLHWYDVFISVMKLDEVREQILEDNIPSNFGAIKKKQYSKTDKEMLCYLKTIISYKFAEIITDAENINEALRELTNHFTEELEEEKIEVKNNLERFRFDTNIFKTITKFQDLMNQAKRLKLGWTNKKIISMLLEALPNSFTSTVGKSKPNTADNVRS